MKTFLTLAALTVLVLMQSGSTSKIAHAQEKKKVWIKVIDSVMVSEDLLNQAARDAVIADKCEREIKKLEKEKKTNLWRGRIEVAGISLIYFMFTYWKK